MTFLKIFGIGLLLVAPAFAADTKPNVLLFVVDDLGWTDLACYGSDFHRTPRIDRLAAEGMRFTDAYSSSVVCSPTRASLMTGKYPAKLHLTAITDGSSNPKFTRLLPPVIKKYLDPDEYTLAEALRDGGYQTIHIGKWHLGKDEKYWPENQGFDINIGGWRAGMPILQEGKSNGYFSPYGNSRLKDGLEDEYLTERLTREAVDFLKNRKETNQPFFMNFCYYTVHTPLQAVESKIQKYSALVDPTRHHTNPVYAAMVEHLDDSVGVIMDSLVSLGLDDNTVVLLTSDNGGSIGKSKSNSEKITSNYPLRSGKGDMYEGGVRVPFIARWKGQIKPASTNATPIITADIYPTVLAITQIDGDVGHNAQVDGVDLSSLLISGEPLKERSLFWHYPHYSGFGSRPHSTIRKGSWRLVENFEDDSSQLFNLKDDIAEQNNLASQFPKKVKELLSDLRKWREEMAAQIPTVNPNHDPNLAEYAFRSSE